MAESITLSVDDKALLQMTQSIALLALPTGSRKRILIKTGQAVRRQARSNLGKQKTVEGKSMERRKSGKGRVLRKIGKAMTTQTTDTSVSVTWNDRIQGEIAYRHQYGIPEKFSNKKMAAIYGKPDYKQPASRKQAKELLSSGFRLYAGKTRSNRVKTKKPSIKWITENLSMGYAGYMVRALSGKQGKTSWIINTPARPFLGVTPEDGTAILAQELKNEQERRRS